MYLATFIRLWTFSSVPCRILKAWRCSATEDYEQGKSEVLHCDLDCSQNTKGILEVHTWCARIGPNWALELLFPTKKQCLKVSCTRGSVRRWINRRTAQRVDIGLENLVHPKDHMTLTIWHRPALCSTVPSSNLCYRKGELPANFGHLPHCISAKTWGRNQRIDFSFCHRVQFDYSIWTRQHNHGLPHDYSACTRHSSKAYFASSELDNHIFLAHSPLTLGDFTNSKTGWPSSIRKYLSRPFSQNRVTLIPVPRRLETVRVLSNRHRWNVWKRLSFPHWVGTPTVWGLHKQRNDEPRMPGTLALIITASYGSTFKGTACGFKLWLDLRPVTRHVITKTTKLTKARGFTKSQHETTKNKCITNCGTELMSYSWLAWLCCQMLSKKIRQHRPFGGSSSPADSLNVLFFCVELICVFVLPLRPSFCFDSSLKFIECISAQTQDFVCLSCLMRNTVARRGQSRTFETTSTNCDCLALVETEYFHGFGF